MVLARFLYASPHGGDLLEHKIVKKWKLNVSKLNIDCDLLVASQRELKSRVWQCFERTIISYV